MPSSVTAQAINEPRNGSNHRGSGLLVGGMAAARKITGLERAGHKSAERIDLPLGEEFVFGPLNGKHRAPYLSHVRFEAPVSRFVCAPGADQAVK